MNSMRRLLACLVLLTVPGTSVLAQTKPEALAPPGAESLETVIKQYEDASKARFTEYQAARNAAKKNGNEKDFKFEKPSPYLEYSPRFLAIAEKKPEGPEALDAIKMALNTSYGSNGKPLATRAKAIKILADHYATSPKILGLIKVVARFNEDDARAFIDDVISRNPDRKLQAECYQARADALAMQVRLAKEMLKDDARRAALEKARGKDAVAETLAAGEKAPQQIDAIGKILREKYADIVSDLSIGAPMPPLVSEDLRGRPTTLDDFKGKVVVLDIWATWCGPCKAMIPHEREMVARLKDEPFALISISADAEKKTLTDFLAKESMPWNHWWNGAEGKLIDTLSIQHYPTIFVLDTKGVIRYKEVRREELEKAVNTLLDEASAKTAKAD